MPVVFFLWLIAFVLIVLPVLALLGVTTQVIVVVLAVGSGIAILADIVLPNDY